MYVTYTANSTCVKAVTNYNLQFLAKIASAL